MHTFDQKCTGQQSDTPLGPTFCVGPKVRQGRWPVPRADNGRTLLVISPKSGIITKSGARYYGWG